MSAHNKTKVLTDKIDYDVSFSYCNLVMPDSLPLFKQCWMLILMMIMDRRAYDREVQGGRKSGNRKKASWF